MPTLADDGGLEVDALGGAPGVRSHRWLGDAATAIRRGAGRGSDSADGRASRRAPHRADARALALVYQRWRRGPRAVGRGRARRRDRGARVSRDARRISVSRGAFLPERGCYLGELGDEEEARISQRRIALLELRDDCERIAAGARRWPKTRCARELATAEGKRKGKIVVLHLAVRYPFAGVIWQLLHHLIGFRELGLDVYYIEDHGAYVYDPTIESGDPDPSRNLKAGRRRAGALRFRRSLGFPRFGSASEYVGMARERCMSCSARPTR